MEYCDTSVEHCDTTVEHCDTTVEQCGTRVEHCDTTVLNSDRTVEYCDIRVIAVTAEWCPVPPELTTLEPQYGNVTPQRSTERQEWSTATPH